MTLPPGLRVAALLALVSTTPSCPGSELRGRSVESPDGQTYLVIADDGGGSCDPLLVDGRVWTAGHREAEPVEPGMHVVQCGHGDSGISFEVRPGTVFHFDYWGP